MLSPASVCLFVCVCSEYIQKHQIFMKIYGMDIARDQFIRF